MIGHNGATGEKRGKSGASCQLMGQSAAINTAILAKREDIVVLVAN